MNKQVMSSITYAAALLCMAKKEFNKNTAHSKVLLDSSMKILNIEMQMVISKYLFMFFIFAAFSVKYILDKSYIDLKTNALCFVAVMIIMVVRDYKDVKNLFEVSFAQLDFNESFKDFKITSESAIDEIIKETKNGQ